jgi:putative membrane protein
MTEQDTVRPRPLFVEMWRNKLDREPGGTLRVRRGTVAPQRSGVIGWTIRQSIFQRRKGLLMLTATTAAGSGAYSVFDAGESEGLVFAEEAVPELLTPFLERS